MDNILEAYGAKTPLANNLTALRFEAWRAVGGNKLVS